MRYLPHTQEDIKQMLQVAGAADLDDLFSSIPDDCRRKDDMDLPAEPLWNMPLAKLRPGRDAMDEIVESLR